MYSLHLFTSLLLAGKALAVLPTVKLDYSTYQGTPLQNGITQWLGLRYAAPPIGDFRFESPQDPVIQSGVQPATQHGKLCLATGGGPPSNKTDEDCLFLNIYAPSNATCNSKLPVYFFIQGGGFNQLSNPNYNGSGLVTASDYNLITVALNYRVGAYGFLASQEVIEGGSINNGLKDQRKALEWVQKYIPAFGGDPNQVVLGGASAGAQSVCLQVTAYGAATLQTAITNIPYPGASGPPIYMYGPTLDADFVSDYTFRAYQQGKFVKVPAIYGDDTNEGTYFAPNSTASYAESDIFVQNQFPALTIPGLANIHELYPVENTPSFPDSGRFWRQASDVYGDLRYTCPGIYVSQHLALHNVSSWNYHWSVADPAQLASGLGVPHTVEVQAIWGAENTNGGAPDSYYAGQVNGGMTPVVQGYWTSFIRTLHPNELRKAGTPAWEQWTRHNSYQRILFRTNATGMENVPSDQKERCEYLAGLAIELEQ